MNAKDFLIKHNLDENSLSRENSTLLLKKFNNEMTNGLSGEESSLKMIPTYTKISESVKKNESVIVLDAGGTNFRTCLVRFNSDGKPCIEDFQKREMPGSRGRVSAEEFFSILSDSIERFMGRSNRIGFCFSYPATITEDGDGIPLFFSKEIQIDGLVGRKLGGGLLSTLSSRGYDTSNMKVRVVNDTVATLLASISELKEDETPIGFILGTGTNIAYVERCSSIKKIQTSMKEMIINTESGGFNIPSFDLDKEFLQTTKDPDKFQFEKKISGAYLGPFIYFVLKEAVKVNLFTGKAADIILTLEGFSTVDVSTFLEENDDSVLYSKLKNNNLFEDIESVKTIFNGIIRRSAILTSLSLSAIALRNDKKKVLINADGSTFYLVPGLKEDIMYYLDKILKEHLKRDYRIVKIDSSPIIGAAEAGAMD